MTRLPAGWTLEPSRDGDYSVLTEPDCRMSVTIDHVKRHLYPGHGNRHHGRIGMAVYTGRGWRDRMIVDAIAHLRTLLAPARTALPTGWTLEPLPPDHDVVRAANGDVVTLDYHERCLRIGVDRTGYATLGGEYRGRGWRNRLLADAIVYLGGVA